MNLNTVRRAIAHHAGGGVKLGCFSCGVAIVGAGILLVWTVAVLYQLATGW